MRITDKPRKMLKEDELKQLYRDSFPATARVLHRMGANLEDAGDAFHDALLIYLEKTSKGPVDIRTSPKAYIMGTARIVWLNTRKELPTSRDIDSLVPVPAIPNRILLSSKPTEAA